MLSVVLIGGLIVACARDRQPLPENPSAPLTQTNAAKSDQKKMDDLIVLAERNTPAPDGFVVLIRDAKTYKEFRTVLGARKQPPFTLSAQALVINVFISPDLILQMRSLRLVPLFQSLLNWQMKETGFPSILRQLRSQRELRS